MIRTAGGACRCGGARVSGRRVRSGASRPYYVTGGLSRWPPTRQRQRQRQTNRPTSAASTACGLTRPRKDAHSLDPARGCLLFAVTHFLLAAIVRARLRRRFSLNLGCEAGRPESAIDRMRLSRGAKVSGRRDLAGRFGPRARRDVENLAD